MSEVFPCVNETFLVSSKILPNNDYSLYAPPIALVKRFRSLKMRMLVFSMSYVSGKTKQKPNRKADTTAPSSQSRPSS